MLAPARLPLRYHWFNLRWGAPSGRLIRGVIKGPRRATKWAAPLVGCFAFQTNNSTRRFEYPWAYEALALRPGMRVLEIGGGLSGFQFVVDRTGCSVVNVDPGDEFFTRGWPVTPDTMNTLNQVLGTDVTLLNRYLQDAAFPDSSFDRVVSVSVFEHIPEEALGPLLDEVRRVLKPGGLLVLTVDLFLDVQPFTEKATNTYGHNVSVKWIIEQSGMKLVHGKLSELFGHSEFDFRAIQARRSELLIGKYPAMVQTVVLQKVPNV